jgi:S1-C subfamily serine protease
MYKSITIAATVALVACASFLPSYQEKTNVALDLTLGRITLGDRAGTCYPIQKIHTKTGVKLRLLTARHVVRDGDSVGGQALRADRLELFKLEKKVFDTTDVKILRDSVDLDAALIEVTLKKDFDVQLLRLSRTPPKPGQEVWSFGCQAGLIPTFTQGFVCRRSGVDFDIRKESWITSANIFGGASGGPIIDPKTGLVVGTTSALYMAKVGYYAIPITHVHIFIDASAIHAWLNSI